MAGSDSWNPPQSLGARCYKMWTSATTVWRRAPEQNSTAPEDFEWCGEFTDMPVCHIRVMAVNSHLNLKQQWAEDRMLFPSILGHKKQSQKLDDRLNKKRRFGMQIEKASRIHSKSWFVTMWRPQQGKLHCAKNVHFWIPICLKKPMFGMARQKKRVFIT